ncbi:tail fiber protein [Yersinia enterocolitica]|uniref:tail fiber protein n=1 Tax=Yersinia enterocolitica TaxID=630 RepID=UPI00065A8135|nr:bacteriophage tail fiber protein [Yersinia enterocolitica]
MQKIGDIPNTRADNNGEFTDGNVAGGVPPTILPTEWFNTIQRELMSILNAAEIESDPHVFNQVLLSIQKLVSEGIPDLKDASLTQKGIVQLSNATNSNSQILAATPKAVSDLGNLLLKIGNNLSEIKDAGPAAVAQTLLNLGLGDAATKNVGTTAGTVAAGDDPRLVNGWTYGGNKARGWRKDPQGNIEQWGTDPATNGIVAVVTLPIPFPSASFIVNANPLAATISGSGEANNRFYPTSASTFEIRSGTAGTYGFMWNARG